jgi:hypothetical protein
MPSAAERKEMLQKLSDMKFRIPKGQVGIALEYFLERPNVDVDHADAVPWIQGMCHQRLGEVCRDPDRAIRRLADLRLIRKVAKGVYRFEPELLNPVVLEDFDEATKLAAKERDGWKCIVCFQGEAEGLEIQVDHIIPRAKGGSGEITNAQTLCGRHNYMKTNLDQLAFGRKLFENARKIAATDLATSSDAALVYAFCDAVLRIFDEFKID